MTPIRRPAAVARIWAELGGVPLDNRDVVQLVTDAHGRPALLAAHTQALADYRYAPPNAYDWYGTWKWLDALMGCAFDGEWCEVALGNTPEQRFMGTWSDGVPVAEAIVTDDPAAQALPEIDVAAQVLQAVRDAGQRAGTCHTRSVASPDTSSLADLDVARCLQVRSSPIRWLNSTVDRQQDRPVQALSHAIGCDQDSGETLRCSHRGISLHRPSRLSNRRRSP